jgi:HlyD family secretion protein
MSAKSQHNNIVLAIIGFVAVVIIVALIGYLALDRDPDVIQGQVEVTEYRVSSKVPGRILELRVKEGDYVKAGDTLAIIDAPEVRAKMEQAQSAQSAAAALELKAQNGARKEQIQGAYQLWQQAIVQEDVMKKSLDRVSKLYEQKVVAAQKYDETKAQYDAAVAQTKAAKSQYDMAVNGARYEDKAAAQALVAQANGAVQEVESYLGELYLIAPADGIISAIYPKVGELVGQGSPVASVLDVDDIWFTFNVREDYLHGLKQGDGITVIIPALDGKEIPATVNYIAVRESYAT